MIYFLQGVDGGPIKIGYSADVTTRVRQLEAHYGQPLAILATMEGDLAVERELHERFAHLRLSNGRHGRQPEQFRPTPELMAFIGRPLLVGANPNAVELMEPAADARAILSLKGSEKWKAWLDGYAESKGMPVTVLVDLCLREQAKRDGFRDPPTRV